MTKADIGIPSKGAFSSFSAGSRPFELGRRTFSFQGRFLASLFAEAGEPNSLNEEKLMSLGKTLGELRWNELQSIAQERDPVLFAEGLLSFARSLEERDSLDWALKVYGALARISQFASRESAVPASSWDHIETVARGRIQAIQGNGVVADRAEFLLKRFAKDACDPRAILPMLAGSFVGALAETAVLARFAGTARGVLAASRWTPRVAASLSGYLPEVLVFGLMNRAMSEGDSGSAFEGLARAGLGIGALKLASALGDRAYRWLHGVSDMGATRWTGIERWNRAAISQVTGLGGMVLSHKLEENLGLRPKSPGGNLLTDSLASLLSLRAGAALGYYALGRGFRRFHAETQMRAQYYEQKIAQSRGLPWHGPWLGAVAAPAHGSLVDSSVMKNATLEKLPSHMAWMSALEGEGDSVILTKPRLWIKAKDRFEELALSRKGSQTDLYRFDLTPFRKLATYGDEESIALLERARDLGHPRAASYLVDSVPRYALERVAKAQSGNRKAVAFAKMMGITALMQAAGQARATHHVDSVKALMALQAMGRSDIGPSLQFLADFFPAAFLTMARLAGDSTYSLRQEALNIVAAGMPEELLKSAFDAESGSHQESVEALVAVLSLEPYAAKSMRRETQLGYLAKAYWLYPETVAPLLRNNDLAMALLWRSSNYGNPFSAALLLELYRDDPAQAAKLRAEYRAKPRILTLEQLFDKRDVTVKRDRVAGSSIPKTLDVEIGQTGDYVIGRDVSSAIAIPDRRVSRRHAMISARDGQFFLEDARNSSVSIPNHGVWVEIAPSRWRRLSSMESYPLQRGQRIALGQVSSSVGLNEAVLLSLDKNGRLTSTEDFVERLDLAKENVAPPPTQKKPPLGVGGDPVLLSLLALGSGLSVLAASNPAHAAVEVLNAADFSGDAKAMWISLLFGAGVLAMGRWKAGGCIKCAQRISRRLDRFQVDLDIVAPSSKSDAWKAEEADRAMGGFYAVLVGNSVSPMFPKGKLAQELAENRSLLRLLNSYPEARVIAAISEDGKLQEVSVYQWDQLIHTFRDSEETLATHDVQEPSLEAGRTTIWETPARTGFEAFVDGESKDIPHVRDTDLDHAPPEHADTEPTTVKSPGN